MKVLVAGDFCLHGRMECFNADQIVDSTKDIVSVINDADYSIVNLECCVSNKSLSPISKCGPNLQNSEESVRAIKKIGFDCVTLANNHFSDFGLEGVKDSFCAIKSVGLDFVGAGLKLADAQKVKYVSIKDKKLAIINCCEHEFTIGTDTLAGTNPLDIVDVSSAILEAKKCSDKVLIIIHGGSEYYQLPSPRMQKWYRYFIEIGADAVVNHHQHCYSGYEFYLGKPIIYGLGNFCFDNGTADKPWNEGYMVCLEFEDNDIQIETIPYEQCGKQLGVNVLNNKEAFDQSIANLNAIIANQEKLYSAYSDFIKKKSAEYLYSYKLPQNRLLRRLAKKGLLPRQLQNELLPEFLTKERATNMLSYFQCEAHRDLMIPILENYISNLK